MSAEALIAGYLRIAREDLNAAQLLGSQNNRNAIYHCEQAAEKIIRAVLTSEGKQGGIGHQLMLMIDEVPDANPIKTQLRDVQQLSTYATSYRYPTAKGRVLDPPTAQEFATLAQKVESLLILISARFGVDLTKKDQPAKHPGPIR